jgi:hypothetical protein
MTQAGNQSGWKSPTTVIALFGLAISVAVNIAQITAARRAEARAQNKDITEATTLADKKRLTDSIRQACNSRNDSLDAEIGRVNGQIQVWSDAIFKDEMELSMYQSGVDIELADLDNKPGSRDTSHLHAARGKVELQTKEIASKRGRKAEQEKERDRLTKERAGCAG